MWREREGRERERERENKEQKSNLIHIFNLFFKSKMYENSENLEYLVL